MKKIFFAFLMLMIGSMNIMAQSAFQKAVARYAKINSVTANVSMVRHNKALTKDKTAKGTFWMKKKDKVCISVNDGKDKLIMNGSTFTMKLNGRKHTTSSKTNQQFATFQTVFESIINGGETNVANLQGVDVKQSGNTLTVTITPTVNSKQQKRMMFSSFVLEINAKTSALESLRMNEKRGGYTVYTFTNNKFNASFADTVFNP